MDAIDKALAAQDARKAARENEAALAKAVRMYERAGEFPRCLQGWPATAAERTAHALMLKCGVNHG
jgi:hypothetical protein